MVDLGNVAAHHAISSCFPDGADHHHIESHAIEPVAARSFEAGKARLLVGHTRVSSRITSEDAHFSYGVLHFGDHNLQAGVRLFRGEEAYGQLVEEAGEAFGKGDLAEVLRLLEKHFEGVKYSLGNLFRDEQQRILNVVLEATLEGAETRFRQIYEQNAPLMRFLARVGTAPPRALQTAAEFVLNTDIRRAVASDDPDLDRIRSLLEIVERERVSLDSSGLAYALESTLRGMMAKLGERPAELPILEKLESLVILVDTLPFEVDLSRIQNAYWDLLQRIYPEFKSRSDEEAREWVEAFTRLGELLSVRVE
jgi:hypothetical protein